MSPRDHNKKQQPQTRTQWKSSQSHVITDFILSWRSCNTIGCRAGGHGLDTRRGIRFSRALCKLERLCEVGQKTWFHRVQQHKRSTAALGALAGDDILDISRREC